MAWSHLFMGQTCHSNKRLPHIPFSASATHDFNVGDKVKVKKDLDLVMQLQENHGGWEPAMMQILLKTGTIQHVDENGDITVTFGETSWTLNPRACLLVGGVTKIFSRNKHSYAAGDLVKLAATTEQLKKLQTYPRMWNDKLIQLIGQVGTVECVKQDGDLISFKTHNGEVRFLINPKALEKVDKISAGDYVILSTDLPTVDQLQTGHGGMNAIIEEFIVKGATGRVLDIDDDGDVTVEFGKKSFLANPAICSIASKKSQNEGPSAKFKPGDRLRIDRDLDFVKTTQKGHGGWIDAMKKVVDRLGKVLALDCDGDLWVDFGDDAWTLNPEVCSMVKPGPSVTNPTNQSSTKKINNATGASNVKCPFKVEQKVQVDRDLDFVIAMQNGHGGWNDNIRKVINKTGIIRYIDEHGDIEVDFGDIWCTLNPGVCYLVKDENESVIIPDVRPKINPILKSFINGDQVKIIVTADRLKVLQRGHGGWSDAMIQVINQTGIIRYIDENGDIQVDFGDIVCTLNPGVCYMVADKNEFVTDTDVRPKINPMQKSFINGDQVKIVVTADRLKVLQRGHGGWSDAMIQCIGSVGIVKNIDQDGNFKVKFKTVACTINPEALDYMDAAPKDETVAIITTDNTRIQESNGSGPRSPAYKCTICLDANISMVFNCGHSACDSCSKRLTTCHICRQTICSRIKLFV